MLTSRDLIVDRDVLRPRTELPTVKMKEEARRQDEETVYRGLEEELQRSFKRSKELMQQTLDASTRRQWEWLEQRIEKLEEAVERLDKRSRP
jgi:hypothetical protein